MVWSDAWFSKELLRKLTIKNKDKKIMKERKCEINCWCWLAAFSFTISQGCLHPEKARVNKLMYRLCQDRMEIILSLIEYHISLNEELFNWIGWLDLCQYGWECQMILNNLFCTKLFKSEQNNMFTVHLSKSMINLKQYCIYLELVKWTNLSKVCIWHCVINPSYYFSLDQ